MLSRRDILLLFAAVTAGGLIGEATAAPRDAKKRLAELTGGAEQFQEGVRITLPDVTDQARHIPMRVSVDSPMTEDDHVKAIHIVAERNPTPDIASFYLGPDSGKAEVSTRIRLIKTQIVVVAAEMSDGSVRIGKARCKIVGGAGACG